MLALHSHELDATTRTVKTKPWLPVRALCALVWQACAEALLLMEDVAQARCELLGTDDADTVRLSTGLSTALPARAGVWDIRILCAGTVSAAAPSRLSFCPLSLGDPEPQDECVSPCLNGSGATNTKQKKTGFSSSKATPACTRRLRTTRCELHVRQANDEFNSSFACRRAQLSSRA